MMIRSLLLISAALFAIALSGHSSAQSNNRSLFYLNQTAELMDKPAERARIASSIFILHAMNEALASETATQDERVKKIQKLSQMSQFIEKLKSDDLKKTIDTASITDFDRGMKAYNNFTEKISIRGNEPLYESGRRALAVSTLATKISGAPIAEKSLCDSFYFRWICKQFS